MAGAKRELQEAIGDLKEPQAELVLSLVHYLRAREAGAKPRPAEESPRALEGWARGLVLLLALEDVSPSETVGSLLSNIEGDPGWSPASLSESVLARDWERSEEDEAWADL